MAQLTCPFDPAKFV